MRLFTEEGDHITSVGSACGVVYWTCDMAKKHYCTFCSPMDVYAQTRSCLLQRPSVLPSQHFLHTSLSVMVASTLGVVFKAAYCNIGAIGATARSAWQKVSCSIVSPGFAWRSQHCCVVWPIGKNMPFWPMHLIFHIEPIRSLKPELNFVFHLFFSLVFFLSLEFELAGICKPRCELFLSWQLRPFFCETVAQLLLSVLFFKSGFFGLWTKVLRATELELSISMSLGSFAVFEGSGYFAAVSRVNCV